MFQFLGGLVGTAVFICAAMPFISRRKATRFSALLMAVAGCAFCVGIFGSWLDNLIGWIPRPLLGGIALCALLFLGIGLWLDAKDGKVDKRGQWIAFAIPIMLILLPGAAGVKTQSVVEKIGTPANSIVTTIGASN